MIFTKNYMQEYRIAIFFSRKLYLKVKNQLDSYADEGVEGNELLLAMKKDFPI